MTRALLSIAGAAAAAAHVSGELATRWANLDARLDRLERLVRALEFEYAGGRLEEHYAGADEYGRRRARDARAEAGGPHG